MVPVPLTGGKNSSLISFFKEATQQPIVLYCFQVIGQLFAGYPKIFYGALQVVGCLLVV
jgi:hypothetical protein